MKFNLSIASVILIALFTLNGCSKTESTKAVTATVQVIDEKLKPFMGKWGHDSLGDCITGGTVITSDTVTIVGEKPEKIIFTKDGAISLMSGATFISLSADKSYLIYHNSDGLESDFRKCISGKFKIIKTDGRNKDYSLTVFVESEDGVVKDLELTLSAEQTPKMHDFVKSSVGKVLIFEYETIYDEDTKARFNLITSVK